MTYICDKVPCCSFLACMNTLWIIPRVTCHACTPYVYRKCRSKNGCIDLYRNSEPARTNATEYRSCMGTLNWQDHKGWRRSTSLHVQKAWPPPALLLQHHHSEHMPAITIHPGRPHHRPVRDRYINTYKCHQENRSSQNMRLDRHAILIIEQEYYTMHSSRSTMYVSSVFWKLA